MQDSFDFSVPPKPPQKAPTVSSQPPPRKRNLPPLRRAIPSTHPRHFALSRVRPIPARPRVRTPRDLQRVALPYLTDDRIRPYPEWPLRCIKENMLAFESEADGYSYFKKSPGASFYRVWACAFCRRWHFEAYPQEVSGSSSGKGHRKEYFLNRRKQS